MLDLPDFGSRFLVALLIVSCSAEDPSESESTANASTTGTQAVTGAQAVTGTQAVTGAQAATTGTGPGNVSTGTTGSSQTATVSTGAGPASTTGASVGGDSGGSGGSGGSGDGPSAMGFGFGFGAGGATGAGGSGGTTATTGASSTTGAPSTTGAGGCTPAVSCEPEPLPSTGDAHQDCVDRVNQFRVDCWCLPPLERWTEGESCANEHAQYDFEQDEAHAGFSDGICDNGGNAQNECPGWNSETQIIEGCLQMMYDEGPPPSEQCNGQCFQDHGHFINMTNENYTRVACGFYTTPGGEVWSVQNFR